MCVCNLLLNQLKDQGFLPSLYTSIYFTDNLFCLVVDLLLWREVLVWIYFVLYSKHWINEWMVLFILIFFDTHWTHILKLLILLFHNICCLEFAVCATNYKIWGIDCCCITFTALIWRRIHSKNINSVPVLHSNIKGRLSTSRTMYTSHPVITDLLLRGVYKVPRLLSCPSPNLC